MSEGETEVSEPLNGPRNGSTRRVYVSLEEAVELLQYDLSYVKSLRTKGVLKTAGRNSNLISVASINAILSKKQVGSKRQGKSEGMSTGREPVEPADDPGMKEALEHDTEVVSEMNAEGMIAAAVAAMRENPLVSDEELMVILGLKRLGSARFWKVKAQSLLDQEQLSEEYAMT